MSILTLFKIPTASTWQGVARSGNFEKPLFYPRKNLYNQNFCRIIFLEEVNHTKALR